MPTSLVDSDRAPRSGAAPGGRPGWCPRTFLLTDIVGSVALWERDADAMVLALVRHGVLINRSVVGAGGEVVRSMGEGDSTLSVFVRPSAAVAAAVSLQAALTTERWPRPVPLRVRAGIHTGDARPWDGGWYGPAVNRAARLRGLAGESQTLVSGVTARLVTDRLPEGVRLSYRGRRTLRGIQRPEDVWELTNPASTSDEIDRVRTKPPDHLIAAIDRPTLSRLRQGQVRR
jgi:class 3 adenylate cyclase